MKTAVLSAFILGIICWGSPVSAKIWTGSNGKTIEAELVEVQGEQVKLRRPNGSVISTKITSFSEADQDFLRKESQKKQNAKDDASSTDHLEVLTLSVGKPFPKQEDENETEIPMMHSFTGTSVSVLVRIPEKSIIDIDGEKSVIDRFRDDQKKDLLSAPKTRQSMFYSSPISIGPKDSGGRWAVVEFSAPNPPTPAAQKISLQGKIVLLCGAGSTTSDHTLEISKEEKISINGNTISIEKTKEDEGFSMMGGMGEPFKTSITLISNFSFDTIKSLRFLDEKGQEIESKKTGSFHFGFGEKAQNKQYYQLKPEMEKITIRLEMYESTESHTIPVSIETGLGI